MLDSLSNDKSIRGYLTDKEWSELITLEYVLTWGYSDDLKKDEERYQILSDKKWKTIELYRKCLKIDKYLS